MRYAGDLFHDVVERLEVLDVDGGEHGDPGVEQRLDVVEPFGVPAAGDVGVGELVDDDDLGPAGEDGVEVHLGELRAAVGHRPARDDLQAGQHGLGERPAVRLDEPDDDVGAALPPPAPLFEHLVGLADAGRGAEVDPQLSARQGRTKPFR